MYRKIAVAVDETDSAARAVREAVAVASETEAAVLFLHVGGDAAGEKALGWAAAHAQRAGVTARTWRVALDGRAIGATIVREADRWGADLLVVGRHNRRGLNRLLLGSVAEAVVRAAQVPVLLVHRGTLATRRARREDSATPHTG
jgi:nucleotide-binding universal stress UspA family protein